MFLRHSMFTAVLLCAAAVDIVPRQATPVEAHAAVISSPVDDRLFSRMAASTDRDFFLQAQTDGSSAQTGDLKLPEGKGKALAQKNCITCHAAKVWMTQHHTRAQWSTILDNMVSKGMGASEEDLATLTDYLAKNFGPVGKDGPPGPSSSDAPHGGHVAVCSPGFPTIIPCAQEESLGGNCNLMPERFNACKRNLKSANCCGVRRVNPGHWCDAPKLLTLGQ